MPLVIQGRESIAVEEGKHKGVVKKLEQRTSEEGYEYLDVSVTVDEVKNNKGEAVVIRYGCPMDLTRNTKLGKLVMNFGVAGEEIDSGENVDLEKVLKVGTKVTYLTKNEPAKKGGGMFARIIDGTLKPQ